MNIDTGNPKLEKPLQELKELVLAEGAFLHPQVTVRERAGSFDVCSSLAPSVHDRLFKIPVACLPVLAAFDLHVSGQDICISSIATGTSSVQVRCMELMLAIFNISGKLADFRKQSPWFSMAPYPEILQKLLSLRDGSSKFAKKQRLLENNKLDELLLSSFLDTRHFKMPDSDNRVLMPFIDYINHHFLATGFMLENIAGSSALCASNARSVSDSDEVFVSYFSMMDPVDSWLNYNFVDESTPIVKSVPLVLELGEGKQIRVKSLFGHRKQAPPKQLQDLTLFLPNIIGKSENHLTVSRIIIPHDKAPLALRRILRALILTLCPGLEKHSLQGKVEQAEADLIDANIRFYRDLGDSATLVMNDYSPETSLNQINRIVQLQLAKLTAYQQRIEKMETH